MSIWVPPTPEMVSARSPRQAACLSPISVENGSQVSKGGNLFQRVFFGKPKVQLFVPQVMSKYADEHASLQQPGRIGAGCIVHALIRVMNLRRMLSQHSSFLEQMSQIASTGTDYQILPKPRFSKTITAF